MALFTLNSQEEIQEEPILVKVTYGCPLTGADAGHMRLRCFAFSPELQILGAQGRNQEEQKLGWAAAKRLKTPRIKDERTKPIQITLF